MAIIEFFKIKIKNQEDIEQTIDFSNFLKNKLDEMSDSEKYCTHGRCDASMVDYISNKDNITFDFIKFKKELIHSTIISEPSDETDTFEAFNQKIIDSSEYSKDEIKIVKKIIKKNQPSIFKVKEELEKTDIDKFSIYKIIKEKELEIIEDKNKLSELFYKANLERLRKFKTFFNIVKNENQYNILLLEKNKDGFDYKKLQDYLNRFLLKEENFSIKIEHIYDNDFMNILENSVLERFKFTIDLQEESLLNTDGFTNFFEQISNGLGKNKITIISDAQKNSALNNEKITNFFHLLSEAGLLESAKVKKQGTRREVDSLSKGELLLYSDSSQLETLENANRIFQKAIDDKKDTMDDDIWK